MIWPIDYSLGHWRLLLLLSVIIMVYYGLQYFLRYFLKVTLSIHPFYLPVFVLAFLHSSLCFCPYWFNKYLSVERHCVPGMQGSVSLDGSVMPVPARINFSKVVNTEYSQLVLWEVGSPAGPSPSWGAHCLNRVEENKNCLTAHYL